MPSTRNTNSNQKKISQFTLLGDPILEQAAAVLYLAQDDKTENQVFLLTLQPDAIGSGDMSDRFLRRAETLSQLEHEAILPLLDHGLDKKRPFAVMPYRPGQVLAEFLESNGSGQPGKEKTVESLKLVRGIAEGLAAAHPVGLIHHDLRPENIFLDESGSPFLLDLAVPPNPASIQNLPEAPTELDYRSPEQLAGKALSGRSNIFSLGVLLYRLLAGQKPALPVSEWDIFEHKGLVREEPLQKVRTDLTEATYKTVQDCLWQKEWSRFETMDAFCRAIDNAIAAESAPAPPPPPIWLQPLLRLREPKTQKVLIPIIVGIVLLLLVFFLVRGRANRQQNEPPTAAPEVLQLDDSAVFGETENAAETQPTSEPSPKATEPPTAAPTSESIPTNTAVPSSPTALPPTSTATFAATETPTPEPTATATACIPLPPFGWVRYEIQANDSLSSLSQATGTTVERLMEVNCLETILLSIGQGIWLPSLPPQPETPTQIPVVTTATGTVPSAPPSNPTSPPAPITPTPTPPDPPTPEP